MRKSLKDAVRLVDDAMNKSPETLDSAYGVVANGKENWRTRANNKPLTITRTNRSTAHA